jgi:hypothetical protein
LCGYILECYGPSHPSLIDRPSYGSSGFQQPFYGRAAIGSYGNVDIAKSTDFACVGMDLRHARSVWHNGSAASS